MLTRHPGDPVASPKNYQAVIKVVGVGGGGCNALNRMIESGLTGVDFVAVNTDAQALLMSDADIKLDIGRELTHGFVAGSDPDIGRQAAVEHAHLCPVRLEFEVVHQVPEQGHGLRELLRMWRLDLATICMHFCVEVEQCSSTPRDLTASLPSRQDFIVTCTQALLFESGTLLVPLAASLHGAHGCVRIPRGGETV